MANRTCQKPPISLYSFCQEEEEEKHPYSLSDDLFDSEYILIPHGYDLSVEDKMERNESKPARVVLILHYIESVFFRRTDTAPYFKFYKNRVRFDGGTIEYCYKQGKDFITSAQALKLREEFNLANKTNAQTDHWIQFGSHPKPAHSIASWPLNVR